ncbi:unnamed protein product, partial [Effrenium voratum]
VHGWFATRCWNTEMPCSPRYDCIDLFSGAEAVKFGLVERGMRTASIDIEQHPSMNILSAAGMAFGPDAFSCLRAKPCNEACPTFGLVHGLIRTKASCG